MEAAAPRWQYLAPRAHPWRRQLYIKGRRLKAFDIWVDMSTNARSVEEAAEDWDLPVEAIREIVAYCETHRQLLDLEAMEEKRRLIAAGVWHGVVSPDR
ncbi:MAG: hypothetical protein HY319_29180 [Armatimonadetes bacterium]|nr:hypothetical protein [Armatimonadota bacterium]